MHIKSILHNSIATLSLKTLYTGRSRVFIDKIDAMSTAPRRYQGTGMKFLPTTHFFQKGDNFSLHNVRFRLNLGPILWFLKYFRQKNQQKIFDNNIGF
jgi:hypothetical protein